MQIIYEDNHLLVINKQAGKLVQGDQTGRITLLEDAKKYLREKYHKPGNVFLGLVHRLDRPASGVVVLARTSKAASRLSAEIRSHRPQKVYWALVEGKTPDRAQWSDRLERNEFTSRVVEAPGGKEARLSYNRLAYQDGVSLVKINLETGRHHQIRVQFSHHGFPLLGDRRYGSIRSFSEDSIALHARAMTIRHPIRRDEMEFIAEPSKDWWTYTGILEAKGSGLWRVCRVDDNGNRFVVSRNLIENEADLMILDYEMKGHKQTYCKEKQNE
jgi:RluA family pseudouridine synthase